MRHRRTGSRHDQHRFYRNVSAGTMLLGGGANTTGDGFPVLQVSEPRGTNVWQANARTTSAAAGSFTARAFAICELGNPDPRARRSDAAIIRTHLATPGHTSANTNQGLLRTAQRAASSLLPRISGGPKQESPVCGRCGDKGEVSN
jgi:hypothetical protein